MQISTRQREAMQAQRRRDVEERIARMVEERFPVDHLRAGEGGVRRLIGVGIESAGRYGFVTAGEIGRYVQLMLVLGSGFDADPWMPWARRLLTSDRSASPRDRMGRLHRRAVEHVGQVAGDDGALYVAALRRARALSYERLAEVEGREATVVLLASIHPEMMGTLDAASLSAALSRVERTATEHGPLTRAGTTFFVLLTFLLGHGVAREGQCFFAAQPIETISPGLPDPCSTAPTQFQGSDSVKAGVGGDGTSEDYLLSHSFSPCVAVVGFGPRGARLYHYNAGSVDAIVKKFDDFRTSGYGDTIVVVHRENATVGTSVARKREAFQEAMAARPLVQRLIIDSNQTYGIVVDAKKRNILVYLQH